MTPLLLAALAASAAAAGTPPAAPSETIVYALPVTVPAALPYVALDKGFFLEEGLRVEPRMFSSGREALQALLAGQAQVQSVSETPVVHAILQGNRIVTAATVAEHMEAKLIVRTDRGILVPADLKGRRLATLPGTNSDYFMDRFLEKHGLKRSDVLLANLPPPEMVVAYVKGDIDGYFAWEPHIYYGANRLPKESKIFYPEELYRGRTTVNMDPDFVARRPAAVRGLIRGLLKAEEFVRRHRPEAVQLVARRLRMDPEVLDRLWSESVFRVSLDDGFLELEERIGRWALERSGSKMPLPDFSRFILPGPLSAEKPSAVRLKVRK